MKKNSPKNSPTKLKPLATDQMAFEEAVRQRAYQLWEDSGYPPGEDTAHWLQAERDVLAKLEKTQ